jgi:hypothetical protein
MDLILGLIINAMNPIVIVTLLTIVIVVLVLLFGRKKSESPKEEIDAPSPAESTCPACPVCPACPAPIPCPEPPKEPQPIRIILETSGTPIAHQNQIVMRESPYRPLYTPVDPTLFLKNPIIRIP